MRRIFNKPKQEADIRPAFFALSALMMILLPTLLMITNPQKMIGIPLSIAGGSQDVPPTPPGVIEKIIVLVQEDSAFQIKAHVRKTDVLASSGDVEQKSWHKDSWDDVLTELQNLKRLDPERKRIQLSPALSSSTQEIVLWMDQLQSPDLFPEVILGEEQ